LKVKRIISTPNAISFFFDSLLFVCLYSKTNKLNFEKKKITQIWFLVWSVRVFFFSM
jgi:hypothetical protein